VRINCAYHYDPSATFVSRISVGGNLRRKRQGSLNTSSDRHPGRRAGPGPRANNRECHGPHSATRKHEILEAQQRIDAAVQEMKPTGWRMFPGSYGPSVSIELDQFHRRGEKGSSKPTHCSGRRPSPAYNVFCPNYRGNQLRVERSIG